MKRDFLLVILTLFFFPVFAQWNAADNIEQKCAHLPDGSGEIITAGIYNWQSPLLENYDVKFYWLDLEVSNMTTYISGNTTINAEALVAIDTFAFELVPDISINQVLIEGAEYTNFTRQGDNVLVPVSTIAAGTHFTAWVDYEGDPGSVGFLSGLTKDYNNNYDKHVVWSLSEPFGAKTWFAVKQDLEDKADSCWVFLTTASTNMAGSQGILTNIVDVGDGKYRYEWKSKYPIDYYLISFAVAEYQEYNIYAHPEEMNGDSILIQNFIYDAPGCLDNNKAGMDATAEMVELMSDLYILYPFHEEKYGHCLTELGGGMEHQTMTTIGSFNFGLVAHELGHMWFGDNVTCATWSDIWINEGFATYSNYLAEAYINGWESGKTFIASKQNSAISQPGGSTYIPEEEITEPNQWRIFNGRLSYNKGAAIIHTLRHEIQDDELFFTVMRTFQEIFTDSTATGEDFKNVAEDVTGMDFDQFFEQWYYGEGYPSYAIEYYEVANELYMTVTQSPSASVTPFFEMLMEYRIFFSDDTDTLVKLYQTDNINTFTIDIGEKNVKEIEVDPEQWTMEKVSSISVTVDESDSPVYFTIGPNPVSNSLNIYLLNQSHEPREIIISDLSGKVISRFSSSDNHIRYEASALKSGVYLVDIDDGINKRVRKFVK